MRFLAILIKDAKRLNRHDLIDQLAHEGLSIREGYMEEPNAIQKFIDHCLIDDYATKDPIHGFFLDVDSISENDQSQLIDILLDKDDVFKDMVFNYIQGVINQRLNQKEQDTRESLGLHIVTHSNGSTEIERSYYR